jgi:putative transposase
MTTFSYFTMTFNPEKHHRRSIRLKNYDYSNSGVYFITICTHQRKYIFGHIHNSIMHLNPWGQIIAQEWEKSADIRQEIILGTWVVMPNHFHAIVQIDRQTSPTQEPPPTNHPKRHMKPRSLSSLISSFKASATRQIRLITPQQNQPIWQRNYHEHIIRDRDAWEKINHYIDNNPKKWHSDRFR